MFVNTQMSNVLANAYNNKVKFLPNFLNILKQYISAFN